MNDQQPGPKESQVSPPSNIKNDFGRFSEAIRKGAPYPQMLLALDPGHTTGVAFFVNGRLKGALQVKTHPISIAIQNMGKLIDARPWNHLTYENYRVYSDKRDQHVHSEVHTIRLIGVIETMGQQRCIPITNQMASDVKGFFHDDRLRQWGYYHTGSPHANDAIRHGCYALSYGVLKQQARGGARDPGRSST
jgi:hypothetical protein